MSTLVECVPNFSEGRDQAKVDAIITDDPAELIAYLKKQGLR